jgi:N-acetylglutamate synthase-like GNAT family acetyltransferase
VVETAGIVVRRAGSETDWTAVLGLLRRAFAYMEGRIDPPSSLTRLDADDLAVKGTREVALLACCDGDLVGCVFCEPRSDCLYIAKLAVEPVQQGRGIGRLLVAAAEAEARRSGSPALELETRIELIENHKAFASMGFATTAETAHPGFDRPTSITMRKVLSAGAARAGGR